MLSPAGGLLLFSYDEKSNQKNHPRLSNGVKKIPHSPLVHSLNNTVSSCCLGQPRPRSPIMQQLTGKKALITGATKGIGRAIAKRLATAGADIACTYLHNTQQAHTLLQELQATGARAYVYQNDAADHNTVQTLVEKVVADLDGLDILVNNAGITQDHLLLRMHEQAWDKVLQVNLKSAFNTVKAATKIFIKQRSGVIINIGSVVGIRGNAGQANYAASKAGLIGFTKSVA